MSGARLPTLSISVLGLLTILAYGSWFYGFGVILDDIAAEFDSGVGRLALGYALAQISTGFLGMAAGRALDRRGAGAPLAVGLVFGPSLLFASSFAQDPLWFSVAFGIGGGAVGATCFYHLTQTIVSRLAPGHEALSIARLTVWGAFSSPILLPLTELSRSEFGWRTTIRFSAALVALAMVLALFVLGKSGATAAERPSTSSLAALRRAWRSRSVRWFTASSMLASFGASTLMVLQIPAMVDNGVDRGAAANLAGGRGLAQLLGRLPLGRLLAAAPATRLAGVARTLVALGAVILAVTDRVWIGIVFVVLAGIGIGASSPLEGIVSRQILPADDLGTLMGSLHLVGGITSGLGPVLSGLLVDATDAKWSGLTLAAALCAMSSLIMFVVPWGEPAIVDESSSTSSTVR